MDAGLSTGQTLGLIGAAVVTGVALAMFILYGLSTIGNEGLDPTHQDNAGAGCGILGLVLLGVAAFIAVRVLIIG